MANPIKEKMKENVKMNPPAQTPLKAPAKQKLPGASPPLVSQPRPMPPPPPMRPPLPRPRGLFPPTPPVQPPPTPYAKELKKKSEAKLQPTICDLCGNSKRINEVKNKKGQVIKYEACPKCVDTE